VLSQLLFNLGHCVFEPPFGGEGLGTTYDVHLGLIGKRVVDFLLVLIDLFSLGVTADSLRAKTNQKSAISLQRGHFDSKFEIEGVTPTNHFCTVSWASECLTTLPLTVFTQRNFVEDFLQAKCDFTRKLAVLRFWDSSLGDLGATYDDHLRLIGKRVVDFLLALIELFSLGVTTEALRAIIGSKSAILLQRGPVDPKFQVEGVPSHQQFFFSVN